MLVCSMPLSSGVMLAFSMEAYSSSESCGLSSLVLAMFDIGVSKGCANEIKGTLMAWYSRRGKKNRKCKTIAVTDGLF